MEVIEDKNEDKGEQDNKPQVSNFKEVKKKKRTLQKEKKDVQAAACLLANHPFAFYAPFVSGFSFPPMPGLPIPPVASFPASSMPGSSPTPMHGLSAFLVPGLSALSVPCFSALLVLGLSAPPLPGPFGWSALPVPGSSFVFAILVLGFLSMSALPLLWSSFVSTLPVIGLSSPLVSVFSFSFLLALP